MNSAKGTTVGLCVRACVCVFSYAPDDLVEGAAKKLTVVSAEAEAGDSFAVGALEFAQTLTISNPPQLQRGEFHNITNR